MLLAALVFGLWVLATAGCMKVVRVLAERQQIQLSPKGFAVVTLGSMILSTLLINGLLVFGWAGFAASG